MRRSCPSARPLSYEHRLDRASAPLHPSSFLAARSHIYTDIHIPSVRICHAPPPPLSKLDLYTYVGSLGAR